ncbi:trypsin-like peptidase domain-containing protein [Pseudonocardia sp. RS11V-5]|uniref:S1C family serine protease n=1 Tax=Pseudonocardia terrae TaxID=2905831 RepID=UPI001E380CDE|nr:trypsin-like peptidase domain-containing protein [Pseudonocardia terrae]MCE3556177.1 trypsin-like peptidase domain-containing protein [Pseudonocardia terrae]
MAPPSGAVALEQAYTAVVPAVLPSVVQITTDRDLGSGVVFDDKGHIVTNAHVVGDATTFQVRLASTPTPLPATLVAAYRPDDLAVIKLDAPPPGLQPARFGDSTALKVGDIVLAMGNPLGLTGTVTDGIVSAVGRTVSEPAGSGRPGAVLPDVVQTSAAINPGNSGGALVNLSGQVVGIPTLAALSPSANGANSSAPAPGLGFAIPANIVTDIAGQIIAHGTVVNSHRAALGVGVVTVVDGSGQPGGAGVVEVTPDGPAAAAGINPGSIITAVNNTPVHNTQDLSTVLAQLAPGQHVPVTLTNPGGGKQTVAVTLGELPAAG